ncbi:MAG: AmmeMemoRadiSam system protein B [Deltaproteobacteria bacterium]|nr:AmmeMemoRadiSam system protein B [Deltaproteobacteria bacterium]
MLRKPAVANQFYPGESAALKKTVESLVKENVSKEDAFAIIAPHAGYIYSGKVAGSLYSRVRIPDNIILLGPNHTGLGERAAIMSSGEWEIPFGKVAINQELAHLLIEESHTFSDDSTAHLREHSLEVQLPFIHHFNPKASIVPVTIMYLGYKECEEVGKAVAHAIRKYTCPRMSLSGKDKVLIAVSSDMNHYESDAATRKKDKKAIDKIIALNPKGLMETVSKEDISMCGIIPATIALIAAKELGAKKTELVGYATSGDTSGDYAHVVGYAGILIK